MDTKRILSALCYFSIMYAGILFPLVAYLASDDGEVKFHAKKALLSHLIPLIPMPFILVAVFLDFTGGTGGFPVLMFSIGILMVILSFIVLVWNLVKGIKVLTIN
ncbi:DUF4870 domain-containing protein [Mesobacillus jeotgali]|uniref:DUF4870 domain-containing protein n=1 Tax=Mesobacillus jeotgali TaxID=129985 RepID=UPI0009A70128|nr:DUF4870 domain-containing protein [Mesobacillus jeotgali]